MLLNELKKYLCKLGRLTIFHVLSFEILAIGLSLGTSVEKK